MLCAATPLLALFGRVLADERPQFDFGKRVTLLDQALLDRMMPLGKRLLVRTQRRCMRRELVGDPRQAAGVVLPHALEHVRRRDRTSRVQRLQPPFVADAFLDERADVVERNRGGIGGGLCELGGVAGGHAGISDRRGTRRAPAGCTRAEDRL